MFLYQNVQVIWERVVLDTACATMECLEVERVYVVQITQGSPVRHASLTAVLMVVFLFHMYIHTRREYALFGMRNTTRTTSK